MVRKFVLPIVEEIKNDIIFDIYHKKKKEA